MKNRGEQRDREETNSKRKDCRPRRNSCASRTFPPRIERNGPPESRADYDAKGGGEEVSGCLFVRLFHPSRDHWADHFGWQDAVLAGRTATGRATIEGLRIHDEAAVALRRV